MRANIALLFSVSIPLIASCTDTQPEHGEDELAGELSGDDGGGKADGDSTSTYYTLRGDTRRCASPACGGFFVERINRERTRCADGRLASRCYVASLDASAIGLSDDDLATIRDRAYDAGAVIVRGEVAAHSYEGFGNLGRFDVSEAWTAGAAAGEPYGIAARVEQTGIRCIQAPCEDKIERKLNSDLYAHIADLDFGPSGATEDEISKAWNALTIEGGGGLLVFGYRYWFEENGNWARGREVTQFYTRLQPSAGGGECFVGGCSGQVCSDRDDVVTTCEYRDEYACYQGATCERQADGACGWTQTEELQACLADPPGPPMTAEECEAAGGVVRPDIGDGQVACAEGETELGSVSIGIEGGLCCAAN